jgi:lactoylglutathione lyase
MLVYLHIGGDRFLELFPNGPEPATEREQSFRHICLKTDDLQATTEQLRAAGVMIDRGPSLGKDGNWQAWITDPDGNAIELMQISPDSPQARIARGEPVIESTIIKAAHLKA